MPFISTYGHLPSASKVENARSHCLLRRVAASPHAVQERTASASPMMRFSTARFPCHGHKLILMHKHTHTNTHVLTLTPNKVFNRNPLPFRNQRLLNITKPTPTSMSMDSLSLSGPTWARPGPTWEQPAFHIGPDCFHTGKHCALCLPQFLT